VAGSDGPEADASRPHGESKRTQITFVRGGVCSFIWESLDRPRYRAAVEVAERFADGLATQDELVERKRHLWGPRFCSDIVWEHEEEVLTANDVRVNPLAMAVTFGCFGIPIRPRDLFRGGMSRGSPESTRQICSGASLDVWRSSRGRSTPPGSTRTSSPWPRPSTTIVNSRRDFLKTADWPYSQMPCKTRDAKIPRFSATFAAATMYAAVG